MKRIFYALLIFFVMLQTAHADAYNYSVFEISSVSTEEEFNFTNHIASEFRMLDTDNGIIEINTYLTPSNNVSNGITYNFSNSVRYTVTVQRFNYAYIIPYYHVEHFAVFNNATMFNQTANWLVLPFGIKNKIIWNKETYNTTFIVTYPSELEPLEYTGSMYYGLPASNMRVNALSKFDIRMIVLNIPGLMTIQNKINSLSWLSRGIFTILNGAIKILSLGFFNANFMLTPLLILDTLGLILGVILSMIFVYPYLILMIILTVGNFYVAFRANGMREALEYFKEYYTAVAKAFVAIAEKIYTLIIAILQVIRG